jgi:hypothetical protein
MKLNVRLAAAVLCAFAFPVLAQHDHGQSQGQAQPPMDPAMMEAMMKAGTPGDAHKKLEPFVGTWTTKVKAWMAPGTQPMTSEGTATQEWILDGRYLEQRFSGNFMGMPFKGEGITGYDNIRKQYFGTWMDSMSTCMMTSTGSLDADGKTLTFTGSMPDPMTGKDAQVIEKITVTDADHHTMEMWSPGPDGKMFKMMEIEYSRKK